MISKSIQKRWWFILILVVLTFFLIATSYNSNFIEYNYSIGIYPFISGVFRFIIGWVPLSVGDIMYLAFGCYLFYLIIKAIVLIFKRRVSKKLIYKWLFITLSFCLGIYVCFNIFWGLNYDRKGLISQLKIDTSGYTTDDLLRLQSVVITSLNDNKKQLINTEKNYPANKELFARAIDCFDSAALKKDFLAYKIPSVKPSVYSWWCSYAGVSGYYNPFSGEAQVNVNMPKFVLPFTTCHEIAHQLGYARENEANFAGFLTATSSKDPLFNYSAYLEVFLYANRELYYADSVLAKDQFNLLDQKVKTDIKAYRDFILQHSNIAEPIITWIYGKYLKANQQPKGIKTYNEVLSYLIAYYKQYGRLTL